MFGTTMTRANRLYFIVALLLIMVAGPACYTILKHPRLAKLGYERPEPSQCESCHSNDEIWSFHQPAQAQYYFDWLSGGWGYYYDIPWWYEDYWG